MTNVLYRWNMSIENHNWGEIFNGRFNNVKKKIMHWICQQIQLHLKDLHGQKKMQVYEKDSLS